MIKFEIQALFLKTPCLVSIIIAFIFAWTWRLRILGKAPTIMNNKIHVAICKESIEVWLVNSTDSAIPLRSGELFGFGLGSIEEVPLGHYL